MSESRLFLPFPKLRVAGEEPLGRMRSADPDARSDEVSGKREKWLGCVTGSGGAGDE